MTTAGTSAGAEARRLRSRADEHRRQAEEADSTRDATRSPSAPRPRPLGTRESMVEAERERRKLERRQSYVGTTRARDGLWVATHAY